MSLKWPLNALTIICTTLITILTTIANNNHHHRVHCQSLPDDVELVNNQQEAVAHDKLAMPFNNGGAGGIYQQQQYPPYPVLLDPQLVRPRGLATLVRFMRSKLQSQIISTCTNLMQQRPAFRASATLFGDSADAGPMGTVVFTQHPLGNPLLVTINATGMPPGKHAVHIHAYGDLKEGCKSTGPHLRHILIGNVEVKEDGKLEINFHSPYLSLFGPNKGIIGRSIVIHEKPIEFNRFPDIRGYPIVPTLNDQNVQQVEEMAVGAFVACGVITITDN